MSTADNSRTRFNIDISNARPWELDEAASVIEASKFLRGRDPGRMIVEQANTGWWRVRLPGMFRTRDEARAIVREVWRQLESHPAHKVNDQAGTEVTAAPQRPQNVQFHLVADRGWIHSHGMEALGLPELEARHVPGFLGESAAHLLRQICHYMIESPTRIQAGEVMALSDRMRVRFISPEPIPGDEDHYAAERLQIVDVEPTCDCCRPRPSGQC